MKLPIGFAVNDTPLREEFQPAAPQETAAVKSLVQIYFPARNQSFTYFNDRFDLKQGDLVFVEGKLEGIRGMVREVNKSFKIKISDYKKVLSVADTNLSGQVYMAGSHFVAYDESTLPYEKIRSWYLPPAEEDAYEVGNDGTTYILNELENMSISKNVWERGWEYYMENRVRYLCVDKGRGRAIVEGERAYEVEFDYADGAVSNVTCTCPCGFLCKHAVATLLQLRECLLLTEKHYSDRYENRIAAILKGDFFRFVIDRRESGSFTF